MAICAAMRFFGFLNPDIAHAMEAFFTNGIAAFANKIVKFVNGEKQLLEIEIV